MKVIFLDIDGPMIPVRAYHLPEQTKPASVFDSIATALLNRLIKDSGAKLVISSTWRQLGREKVVAVLVKNGIDPTHLHEDWQTPLTWGSNRDREISLWLEDHPEVTNYVAIDDEQLHVDIITFAVKADTYDGLSYRNYLEARIYLNAYADDNDGLKQLNRDLRMIRLRKRAEVERVARRGEENEYLAQELAVELVPYTKDDQDADL